MTHKTIQRANMPEEASLADRINGVISRVMNSQGLPIPGPNDDLYTAGLTSMGMVRLMLAVEVEFDVTVPDSELIPENFRSFGSLEQLLARLRYRPPNG
jgi:acyl carrier protein